MRQARSGVITLCLLGLVLVSSWSISRVEAGSSVTTLGMAPWPMFRHDLARTGHSPYVGSQTFNVKWNFDTGGEIESTPAIDGMGNIYVQSLSGYLYSLDASGTLRWRYPTLDSSVGCCVAPESSPAVDSNGVVYVGSSAGNLYSISSNGTLKWRFATGGPIQSSPAIGNDGTIYVGSYDGNLYAIAQNGLLKWKFATAGIVVSSPAIDSR